MNVRVRRAGLLTEEMPVEVRLECAAGATLRDVVDGLASRFGPPVTAAVLDGGRLRAGVVVLLDGRSAASLRGLDTPLRDGSEVLLTLMAAGGD